MDVTSHVGPEKFVIDCLEILRQPLSGFKVTVSIFSVPTVAIRERVLLIFPVLLTYYNQSCRSTKGCDLMVTTCVRVAYDLGLHKLDENEPDLENPEYWASKEEQRRAWWCVWELDTFDSISSRRPFTINWNRVSVCLPVSDEAWFAKMPIKSAMLSSDILHCWKALKDSPNQDERAWFLISNYILAQALELCQQRYVSSKSINDIETVVSCFSLLFHEKFRKTVNNLIFDDNTYGKSTWTILTQLMVQS